MLKLDENMHYNRDQWAWCKPLPNGYIVGRLGDINGTYHVGCFINSGAALDSMAKMLFATRTFWRDRLRDSLAGYVNLYHDDLTVSYHYEGIDGKPDTARVRTPVGIYEVPVRIEDNFEEVLARLEDSAMFALWNLHEYRQQQEAAQKQRRDERACEEDALYRILQDNASATEVIYQCLRDVLTYGQQQRLVLKIEEALSKEQPQEVAS